MCFFRACNLISKLRVGCSRRVYRVIKGVLRFEFNLYFWLSVFSFWQNYAIRFSSEVYKAFLNSFLGTRLTSEGHFDSFTHIMCVSKSCEYVIILIYVFFKIDSLFVIH